ncbi:ABC transporter ATP-binding protein [Psychromarinibacter sp. S121]|uniref:ABC transporter ATP-binding protein n=1 Tax=Psychromarinibacter sp. S121 TaxID=3415127 RepID=UPI003C7BC0F1
MSRDYLRLQQLQAHYGKSLAADDISLNIDKGELIALLGPSGCGKTTTLRMIAGFVQPTSGEVVIDGLDVTRMAPHKRNIGVVFQSYALFPHLTVLGNVAFGLSMRAIPKAQRLERARATLDLVGLGPFADRYPAQLSGGQQQRVALARALVIEPSVLLLDEPLSNLDAHLRGEMRSEIRSLQKRLSITTVFVTHDQAEALAMADRVVVMSAGRIVEIGEPRALCDHPGHEFTASFLGERTVVNGQTLDGVFEAPGFRLEGAPAGSTRAILRAARLRFDAAAGPKVSDGTVQATAYLGDTVETDVTVNSARVRLLTPSDQPVPPVGAACSIHALPGSITFI